MNFSSLLDPWSKILVKLKNKFAIITGAAQRIGKDISLALAQEGVNIIVHYGRSKDLAMQTVKEIRKIGVEAFNYQANLVNPDEIYSMFRYIKDNISKLDILVNNAASFHKSPFLEIKLEDWDRVLAINLRAPFLCSQEAAKLMNQTSRPANETGLIVNLADLSGIYPWLGFAHHGISKAGLIQLTKVAAQELAPKIRVNAIIPGLILPSLNLDPQSEKWKQMVMNVPLQRSGHLKNISQTVKFFATNDYLTGSIINVDGGENLVGPKYH